MTSENTNLSDIAVIIVAAATVIAVLFSIFKFFFNLNKDVLSVSESRARVRDSLAHPRIRRLYIRNLTNLLSWFKRYVGRRYFSVDLLGYCIVISIFYTVVLFLISWSVGGRHELAGLPLLPEHWGTPMRILFVVMFLIGNSSIFIIVAKYRQLDTWFFKFVAEFLNIRVTQGIANLIVMIPSLLIGLVVCNFVLNWSVFEIVLLGGTLCYLAFSLSGTLAVIITVFGGEITLISQVLYYYGVGNIFVSIILFSFFLFIVIVFVAPNMRMGSPMTMLTTFLVAGFGWPLVSHFISGKLPVIYLYETFFLFVIPAVNASADWISLGLTRYLATAIVVRRRSWIVFVHFVVDIGAGVALLAALAIALGVVGELYDRIAMTVVGGRLIVPVNLFGRAAAEPLGPDGLWLTLMLVTTLIPTMAHILMGLVGIVLFATPMAWRNRMVESLAGEPAPDRIVHVAWYCTLIWPVGIVVLSGGVGGFFWLIGITGGPLVGWFYELALWGTNRTEMLF